MAGAISRKQFFRQAFFQTAKFSADLIDAIKPADEAHEVPANQAFEADFPPELLAAEAARLGIDPNNKTAVLAAIAERLEEPRN